ncbi:hypothetical protein [Pelomonas sp. KK5]|uniref:hypothetical protein n=1 Tax=Pelomonas sp. KK5 TaxID=1855730 RepID=UPI00097C1AEF|nr:hypothetical protein [Pelomonas sp. KK5]
MLSARLPLTATLLLALLAGCGTPTQSLTMALSDADVLQLRTWVPEALKNNVDLDRVTGGQSTSPWWGSKVSGMTLEQSLDDSLRALGMLPASPQAPTAYQLRAQIVSLVQPLVAADTTVTITIQYTLVDRNSGAVLYQRALRTAYKAEFTDAMVSMPERLRLANEGAVRENIRSAMRDLMVLRLPAPG